MVEPIKLILPCTAEALADLNAGDVVSLSGIVYTARDAAHQRLMAVLEAGGELPFELAGAAIYYCGPAPTPPGRALGSAGPTSSYRLDRYTPELLARGLKVTIGKGDRGLSVREACRDYGAVYLVTVGGAGAVLSAAIKAAEVVAWPELGPEAVRRLEVEDFPALVAYDSRGGSVFPGDEPLSVPGPGG